MTNSPPMIFTWEQAKQINEQTVRETKGGRMIKTLHIAFIGDVLCQKVVMSAGAGRSLWVNVRTMEAELP